MPLNARRRCVKIVEPIDSNKDPELVGGLKNAFERGESFEKAKQSFINAGYKPSEVESAVPELRKLISPTSQPEVTPVKTKPAPNPKKSQTKKLPTTSKMPSVKKNGIPKILIVVLIVVLTLILVGAAILGLFWDQWF